MNELHLYIGGTEVEFVDKPEILYTYQTDDITNPTVVKNSFSKTITLKGTKNNNKTSSVRLQMISSSVI